MSRPQKFRRICTMPAHCQFGPLNSDQKETVNMTIDEYETIRLIDHLNLRQEECAQRMGVARTTVQAIYNTGRKKMAEALVQGKNLEIDGGNYKTYKAKDMKLAVTYDNEMVFQHFGQSTTFKIYTIENDKIVDTQIISTKGYSHGDLGQWLNSLDVSALICGGIGLGAREILSQFQIEVFPGAKGNVDEAVNSLLGGTLEYDPNAQCGHGARCTEHANEKSHACIGSCGHHK